MADLAKDCETVIITVPVSDHVQEHLNLHSIQVKQPKDHPPCALTTEMNSLGTEVPSCAVAFLTHLSAGERAWSGKMQLEDFQNPAKFSEFVEKVRPLTLLTYNTIGTEVAVTQHSKYPMFKPVLTEEGWCVGRSYQISMPYPYCMGDTPMDQITMDHQTLMTQVIWGQLTSILVLLPPDKILTLKKAEPDEKLVLHRALLIGRFFNMHTGSICRVLCEGGTDTNAYSVDRVLTVLTAVDLLGEMSKVRGTVGWDFQYFANAHTSWREMYNRGDEAPFKGVSKDAYMLAIRRCMLAWATAQGSPEFQLLSSNQKMDIRLKALLKDEKFRTLELMRYASGGCNLQALVQKVGDEYYLVPPISTFAKFTDLLELEGAGLDETVDFDGSVAEMLKPQLNGEPHRATITPWLHQGFILPIDYEYMYVKSDVQRLASDPDKDQDENRSAKKQKVNDGKTLKDTVLKDGVWDNAVYQISSFTRGFTRFKWPADKDQKHVNLDLDLFCANYVESFTLGTMADFLIDNVEAIVNTTGFVKQGIQTPGLTVIMNFYKVVQNTGSDDATKRKATEVVSVLEQQIQAKYDEVAAALAPAPSQTAPAPARTATGPLPKKTVVGGTGLATIAPRHAAAPLLVLAPAGAGPSAAAIVQEMDTAWAQEQPVDADTTVGDETDAAGLDQVLNEMNTSANTEQKVDFLINATKKSFQQSVGFAAHTRDEVVTMLQNLQSTLADKNIGGNASTGGSASTGAALTRPQKTALDTTVPAIKTSVNAIERKLSDASFGKNFGATHLAELKTQVTTLDSKMGQIKGAVFGPQSKLTELEGSLQRIEQKLPDTMQTSLDELKTQLVELRTAMEQAPARDQCANLTDILSHTQRTSLVGQLETIFSPLNTLVKNRKALDMGADVMEVVLSGPLKALENLIGSLRQASEAGPP